MSGLPLYLMHTVRPLCCFQVSNLGSVWAIRALVLSLVFLVIAVYRELVCLRLV